MNPPVCTYCGTTIAADETPESCPACGGVSHADCWHENGGCSVYGCAKSPEVKPRSEIEVPVSWWGRESKPCPACAQEILAAALRCRHCGATFASARPEDRSEFQDRAAAAGRRPQLRRSVILWFVLSLFPGTAPVGAVGGFVCWRRRRAEIEALPGVLPALARLGMLVGGLQTAAVVVLTALYAAFRH